MKKSILIYIFLLLNYSVYSQRVYHDFIGSEDLKSVTFYSYDAQDNRLERILNPPVVNLYNPGQYLVLEFDDLKAGFSRYKARIISCDIDWEQSLLMDMEYLDTINEFYLDDFSVSQNTKVPYYHYRFVVPKPKLSGNYVLQVFEDERVVLEKRFWVYESLIDIVAEDRAAENPAFWKTHQQLNLGIELGEYRIGIPQREMHVTTRMNQHLWKVIDNKDLLPRGRNGFRLNNLGDKYLFPAGNEFRYLDISSTFRKGQNVFEIDLGSPDIIYTYTQGSRARLNYADSYDNNGGYIINNLEGGDIDFTSDYAEVLFELEAKGAGSINSPFILGKLTDWEPLFMDYDAENEVFYQNIMLKNGVYDYVFGRIDPATEEHDIAYYEGNFSQTKNTYEIFVYHIIPGSRHYKLAGYQMIKR